MRTTFNGIVLGTGTLHTTMTWTIDEEKSVNERIIIDPDFLDTIFSVQFDLLMCVIKAENEDETEDEAKVEDKTEDKEAVFEALVFQKNEEGKFRSLNVVDLLEKKYVLYQYHYLKKSEDSSFPSFPLGRRVDLSFLIAIRDLPIKNMSLILFKDPKVDVDILSQIPMKDLREMAHYSSRFRNLIFTEHFLRKYLKFHYGRGIRKEKPSQWSFRRWLYFIEECERGENISTIEEIVKNGWVSLLKHLVETKKYLTSTTEVYYPFISRKIGRSQSMEMLDYIRSLPCGNVLVEQSIFLITNGAASTNIEWWNIVLKKFHHSINAAPTFLDVIESFEENNITMLKYLLSKHPSNFNTCLLSKFNEEIEDLFWLCETLDNLAKKGALKMLQFFFESTSTSILLIPFMEQFWEHDIQFFCQRCFESGNVELIEYLRQFLFSPTFPLLDSAVPHLLSSFPDFMNNNKDKVIWKLEERQQFFREAAKCVFYCGKLDVILRYQQEFGFSLDKEMLMKIVNCGDMKCILHFKEEIESQLTLKERITESLLGINLDIVKYFFAQQPKKEKIYSYITIHDLKLMDAEIRIYLEDNYYLY
jgi:hypothetical protein